jgi:hypothetical protein
VIAYHCDPATRTTVSVWRDVTPADVTSHLDQLAADPNYASSRRLLTDLRAISRDDRPTPEQVDMAAREFAQRLGETMSTAKWAIVARHAFPEASAFDERIRDHVPRVLAFNDLGTACVWLGADVIQIEAIIGDLRSRNYGRVARYAPNAEK